MAVEKSQDLVMLWTDWLGDFWQHSLRDFVGRGFWRHREAHLHPDFQSFREGWTLTPIESIGDSGSWMALWIVARY